MTLPHVALAVGAALTATSPSEDLATSPTILHSPTLERHASSGILRPVPIAVELPPELARRTRRVLVHYRLWGEPDWTTLELKETSGRHSGAIPCLEVSTVTGALRYYVRAHDDDGRVIATLASRAAPIVVTIRHDLQLDADAARPNKCPDPADCPRGLPGCPSERVLAVLCHTDSDCEGGATCGFNGYCEKTERHRNALWVGAEQDFGVIARTGACHVSAQERGGHACIREDGAQYIGTPVLESVPPGGALGPTRITVGYERLVHDDTSIGLALGWAIRGGVEANLLPPLVPMSVAARATHWFGNDPHAHAGIRPFAGLTAGYARFDLEGSLEVREDPLAPQFQGNNDLEQRLSLWRRAGDGFVGLAGGVAYAITPRWSLAAELCTSVTLPFTAVVLAPAASLRLGL